MEESGPSLLCLYAHFLSWRTSETNSRTYSYTFSHLRTHKHAHTFTLWYTLCFFYSLSLSRTQSTSTLYAQMATAISSVCFSTLAALLTVGTFDANIKEVTGSAQSRFSMITCTISGATWLQSKRCNLFLFYLEMKETISSRQKYNYWKSALSVYLSFCLPPTPAPPTPLATDIHNCCGMYLRRWQYFFAMGDNMCRKTRHILSQLKCCCTSTET